MFHLNDNNEIKPCDAKKKRCPFGEDRHFESHESAEDFFASAHNIFEVVDRGSVKKLMKHALESYPRTPLAYTVRGSYLYGLETDSSDFDMFIISSGSGKPRQKIVGEVDFLSHSLRSFFKSINESQTTETDVLYSRSFTFSDGSDNIMPYLYSLRSNPYEYIFRSRSVAVNDLTRIQNGWPEKRSRVDKTLKVVARTALLGNKFYAQGHEFTPRFTTEEHALFEHLKTVAYKELADNKTPEKIAQSVFAEAYSLTK